MAGIPTPCWFRPYPILGESGICFTVLPVALNRTTKVLLFIVLYIPHGLRKAVKQA